MQETPAHEPASRSGPPALVVGGALIAIGAVLLAGQLLGVSLADIGWPIWIVAAGIVILAVGLVVMDESGVVIAGTVVTTVGLVLLYQERTDHWQSWAYAWALVGPAASGLGLIIWGVRTGDGSDVRNGTWSLLGGLATFAIGFLFFEGVIGISGNRLALPDWLLPVAVIAVGVVVLLRGLLARPEHDAP